MSKILGSDIWKICPDIGEMVGQVEENIGKPATVAVVMDILADFGDWSNFEYSKSNARFLAKWYLGK